MKKLNSIAVAATIILFFTAMIVHPAAVQSSNKGGSGGNPIPERVTKIIEKSCVNCHSEPGNPMAMMHLDLSNWDKYSAEKQAAKAKDMCKMVSKDKMPPKKFKEGHPDGVPTSDELKTICDWAQSLQTDKK
jgi:hypothetical protein